ncbi:hypothetical protein ONZ43_g5272 [Nemania bipapillata]|uniref:Uncharacterized protein n=1 Tax=Nemania bipapillata TaxID=110536 RepID=A0ACC2ICQ2_9PEZI|nr:hypothetical protein ONZ43_g5272 [Nemania bipapillata]
MVRHQYDTLIQDEHDVSSRDSLDLPELPVDDTGCDTNIRAGDDSSQAPSVAVASRPDGLLVNTDTATVNTPTDQDIEQPKKPSSNVVGWRDLPRKDQLLVLTLARLSEPLTQTSLQSYMFYQLRWFDPTLPDAVISAQAGILHASFTAAQFFTAMLWGRVADSKYVGRKKVIMIGLLGTLISCLGFGFSRSFSQALFFRSLGGITNGNIGVMRTMISETIREKK